MFRAIISSIFRSTRLRLSLWYTASSVHYTTCLTQSSAPEDGRNYRPKHVQLIEIINKITAVASS